MQWFTALIILFSCLVSAFIIVFFVLLIRKQRQQSHCNDVTTMVVGQDKEPYVHADRTVENVSEAPLQISGSPSQTSPVKQSSVVGSVKKPSKAGSVKKPSKAGSVKKPSKAGSVKKPSKAGSVKKSSKAGSVKKPSKVGSVGSITDSKYSSAGSNRPSAETPDQPGYGYCTIM
jgi:hypothetical protein